MTRLSRIGRRIDDVVETGLDPRPMRGIVIGLAASLILWIAIIAAFVRIF